MQLLLFIIEFYSCIFLYDVLAHLYSFWDVLFYVYLDFTDVSFLKDWQTSAVEDENFPR